MKDITYTSPPEPVDTDTTYRLSAIQALEDCHNHSARGYECDPSATVNVATIMTMFCLKSVTFCLEDELTCIIQHVMSLLMQMRGLWLPSLPMHAKTRLESSARHQRITEDPYIKVLTLKMFLSQQSYLNKMFRRHCIDSEG